MSHSLRSLEVIPNYAVRIRCGADWSLDRDWSKNLHDYDLWYVWAGRGWMTLSDGKIDLYPGRGIWMRPGRHYEAYHDIDQPLGVTAFHFRLGDRKKLLTLKQYVPPVEEFESRHPEYFDSTLTHAFRLASDPRHAFIAGLLVKSLLLEVVSEAGKNDAPGGIGQHHRAAIAQTVTEIHDNPKAMPTVRELARKAGYSNDHYARIFHEVTGLSPKEYIVRNRMQRAVALLRESSHTISQIAGALGYDDVGFFSRQFKNKFGVSPARFRHHPAAPENRA